MIKEKTISELLKENELLKKELKKILNKINKIKGIEIPKENCVVKL